MTSAPPPLAQPEPHPAPPQLPEVPDGVAPTPLRPDWPPALAWAALISAGLTATVFGGIILALSGNIDDPPPAALIIATIVQDVIVIGAALVFAGMTARPAPWQFGLRATPFWRATGWTVLAYVGFIAVSAVWALALNIDEQDNLPDELGARDSVTAMLAVAFLVTVIAPLAEEFFFRGYFFPALRRWGGFWPAATINGVMFGAIHFGSAPAEFLVPLAILGFALCALYQVTGSLYPCIVLHAINNCVAYSVSLDWSWQVPLLFAGSLGTIALALWWVRARFGPAPAVRSV